MLETSTRSNSLSAFFVEVLSEQSHELEFHHAFPNPAMELAKCSLEKEVEVPIAVTDDISKRSRRICLDVMQRPSMQRIRRVFLQPETVQAEQSPRKLLAFSQTSNSSKQSAYGLGSEKGLSSTLKGNSTPRFLYCATLTLRCKRRIFLNCSRSK